MKKTLPADEKTKAPAAPQPKASAVASRQVRRAYERARAKGQAPR